MSYGLIDDAIWERLAPPDSGASAPPRTLARSHATDTIGLQECASSPADPIDQASGVTGAGGVRLRVVTVYAHHRQAHPPRDHGSRQRRIWSNAESGNSSHPLGHAS